MKAVFKKIIVAVFVVLLLFLGVWVWSAWDDLKYFLVNKSYEAKVDEVQKEVITVQAKVDTVETKVDEVQTKVEERSDALEQKIDDLSAKVGSVDSKLDKIILLLEPPAPDGLTKAEGK